MIAMFMMMFTVAFGQVTCDPPPGSCEDDIAKYAVSNSDVMGIDAMGRYYEVRGGWADSDNSTDITLVPGFTFPYTPWMTFSELEGSRGGSEWGCGVAVPAGYTGKVMCWGVSTDDEDYNRPPPMFDPGDGSQWQDDAPYSKMDTSEKAGCAIGATGKILAWGQYNRTEIEDDRPTSGGYTSCSADDLHVCATKPGSGVECWGSNSALEYLGLGTSPRAGTTAPPTSGTYDNVSCRKHSDCFAISDTGSLVYFGRNLDMTFQTNGPAGSDFVEVQLNNGNTKYALARRTSGTIAVWRGNGSNMEVLKEAPTAVGYWINNSQRLVETVTKFKSHKIEDVAVCGDLAEDYLGDIECSDGTALAVDWQEGDLICWGNNSGVCAERIAQVCD
jgi:hypothetical protein